MKECKICSKTFRDTFLLKRHNKSKKHKNNLKGIKKHYCELCDKEYDTNRNLIRHNKTNKHINNTNIYNKMKKEKEIISGKINIFNYDNHYELCVRNKGDIKYKKQLLKLCLDDDDIIIKIIEDFVIVKETNKKDLNRNELYYYINGRWKLTTFKILTDKIKSKCKVDFKKYKYIYGNKTKYEEYKYELISVFL